MVFDPKSLGDHSPVVMHDNAIAQVDSYRFLGIHMDNKLVWKVHVKDICSRVKQKLHFLRRHKTFRVNQEVSCSSGEPLALWYLCTVWYSNSTVKGPDHPTYSHSHEDHRSPSASQSSGYLTDHNPTSPKNHLRPNLCSSPWLSVCFLSYFILSLQTTTMKFSLVHSDSGCQSCK